MQTRGLGSGSNIWGRQDNGSCFSSLDSPLSCSETHYFACARPCELTSQRYINKNRVRYRFLDNKVSCQQLFCHIRSAIQWPNLGNLLHTVWVMQNNTTRWRDLCDKKQLISGFTPFLLSRYLQCTLFLFMYLCG